MFRLYKIIFIAALLLMPVKINAQIQRETRAVWLTTNFRLDWPPAKYDSEIQKAALTEIFDDIKRKNFNTVYFQVRFNGTVLFKSSYEPLSFYITGRLGDTTAYDPLQLAIELAHKRGLEIHAWVNMIKCLDGSENGMLDNSKHISSVHPDWIIKDSREGTVSCWLDPGLPAVRDYLVNVVTELALDYDVDGIQYDYLRYPGKNFDDDFSYGVHGGGMPKDEWRRNNLTEIVKNITEIIRQEKPDLKIGVAPIGIYQNQQGARGLEGYNDTFQDSREWLKLKYIDYAVPQIYWGLDGNPRFDIVARDWVENSFGRCVILGIGAYKPEIYTSMDKLIEFSREINAGGIAFFRYRNIKNYDFNLFANKAFPAAMEWLENSSPEPPSNLCYEFAKGKTGFLNLSWNQPSAKEEGDALMYFSLYSLPSRNAKAVNEDLFEIISASKNSVMLGIKRPKKINYFFTLKSVTKLWNESGGSSNILKVTFPELEMLAGADSAAKAPVLIKEGNETVKALITLAGPDRITISAINNGTAKIILEKDSEAGKSVILINKDISNASALLIKFESSGKEVKINL